MEITHLILKVNVIAAWNEIKQDLGTTVFINNKIKTTKSCFSELQKRKPNKQ